MGTVEGVTDKERWQNRRQMAWLAMIGGLFYPLPASLMEAHVVNAVTGPFYTFVGVVLAAYFGFATVDHKWREATAAKVKIEGKE